MVTGLVVGLTAGCGGSRLDLVGTVERTSIEVTAPTSEEIVEVPVRVGQAVAAGDILVRLDSEVGELELQAAEARHAAAEANLAAAQREFERAEGLSRARVGTAQALDAARQDRDEAQALLAERAAQAAQARKHLADLTLRSRVDGLVDQLPFEVGERLAVGGVAAVVLAGEEPWVRVWIPARAVVRVRPGDPAEIEVEGLAGRLAGRITDVAREPEFTPHYALTERERANLVFEARVVIEGAPEDLRPGIPATVRIPLGRRRAP